MTLLVHPDWSYLPQISLRPICHVLFFKSIVVTGTGNFNHVKFFPSEGLLSQSFLRRFIPAPLLRRGKLDSWKSLLTHHAETQLLNSWMQKPAIHSVISITCFFAYQVTHTTLALRLMRSWLYLALGQFICEPCTRTAVSACRQPFDVTRLSCFRDFATTQHVSPTWIS